MRFKTFRRMTAAMRSKLGVVFMIILCSFLLLVGRLVYINLKYGNHYKAMVLSSQKNTSTVIPFERGKIYDRNKNVLAMNEKLYALVLEPKNILDQNGIHETTTIRVLKRYFPTIDVLDLKSKIEENKDSYYLIYKEKLTYEDVEPFLEYLEKAKEDLSGKTEQEKEIIREAREIRGVTFEESYRRVYPYGSLACRVLGFTSAGNVGNWGIEQSYNSTLNGVDGRTYYYFDEELVLEESVKAAKNGNSVMSTINMKIQQAIEKNIASFDRKTGSEMTSVLVMDPRNGEILGMASSNPYDLNKPMDELYLKKLFSDAQIQQMRENTKRSTESSGRTEKKSKSSGKDNRTIYEGMYELWRNSIISDTNEPGSTYKPFTVAAGLESGTLKGNETYFCSGSRPVGRRNIGCSHVHGTISLKNAVARSCNVAMMNIAFSEGVSTFYTYQNQFGFGRKTGIDLPGEADTSSLVYNAGNYSSDATLATNSFGQNFNCTMMQMAAGFCSLINGGYYYKPHIVKEILNEDGNRVKSIEKELVRETISENTSRKLRSYLKETVESGTGVKAQIEGYSIGGKTGTAEKIPRNKKDYYISFIGFTPVDNPELLVYATIDEPHVKVQDNARLAVKLERACMKDIIDILGIEPNAKETEKN